MHLALYHPWLKSKGGAEKVLAEFMERSSHDTTLYALFYDAGNTFDAFEEQDVQVIGANSAPRGVLDKAIRFGLGSVSRKLPVGEQDMLLVSEAGLGSLITLQNHDLPTACYCHTPLRAALPGFQETYQREVSPLARPAYTAGIHAYSLLERRAWTHFDRVVANSALTKERIVRKGLYAEDNIRVVNPGVDTDAFYQGEYQRYFLYPSRFRRYKRQDLAIKAFREADLDGFKLVLAGDAQEPDYVDELRTMVGENVEIRTDVSDEDWLELYAHAYSILFLAKQEDWGIVPLEGMAAGKPVIAVSGGGYEDIVTDDVGRIVDARPEAIAAAMTELVDADVEAMGAAGREKVKKYDWDNFARALDAELEDVYEARSSD